MESPCHIPNSIKCRMVYSYQLNPRTPLLQKLFFKVSKMIPSTHSTCPTYLYLYECIFCLFFIFCIPRGCGSEYILKNIKSKCSFWWGALPPKSSDNFWKGADLPSPLARPHWLHHALNRYGQYLVGIVISFINALTPKIILILLCNIRPPLHCIPNTLISDKDSWQHFLFTALSPENKTTRR